MRQKIFKCKNLFFVLLAILFVFAGSKQEVSAAVQYKVIFANPHGVVSNTTYKNWAQTVEAGTTIQLPKVQRSGYRTYWEYQNGTDTKRYLTGSSLTVNQNMKLCLKYYKLYNVRYYTANGSKEYTNLRQQACVGQYITLPNGSSTDNWKFVGWTTSLNSTSYKTAGTKVKVTGNMKFYAVLKRVYTIRLCDDGGKVYKKYQVYTNKTLTFPSFNTGTSDMFLGWSTVQGASTQPEYYAYETIPKKTATYYAVVFSESSDRAPSVVNQPTKFDRVYFVGDSRTVDMELALGGSKPDSVKFISKGSQGLLWLKSTAYNTLINDIRKQPTRMKKAVVFNLGVNDMGNYPSYITYMKQIAKTLKSYNCTLYFMSVNPVNSAMIQDSSETRLRTERQVAIFNSRLYSALCTGNNKTYTYINTNYYLKKYGWISNRWNHGIHDGLHYSPNTTLRIYDYCIRYLNK